MELARQTKTALNIASEAELLSYTYTGSTVKAVIARTDLSGLAGAGGNYTLNYYLNSVLVTPTSVVAIPASKTTAIMISRAVPVYTNNIIAIKIVGLGGDTSIGSVTTIQDEQPVSQSDLFGSGAILVNHNYGGTDALTYKTSGGAGIDNAVIYCYTKANYDAGNTASSYILAQTTTNVNGQWNNSLMLDPTAYTLIYFKQGYYGPDRKDVTVT